MSAIFFWKKEQPEKHKFFIFLKGCYYVIGGPIDMLACFERLLWAF